MQEPSKIQISFSDNYVEAGTRQTVEQSIAGLAARSAEARARLRDAEAELEKLSHSINAPFVKLLEADPVAMDAVEAVRNRQLIVPGKLQGFSPPASPEGTTVMTSVPPYDFSWNWHDGDPPSNQIITRSTGYVGIDARAGADGGPSGPVNAHAGFGIIIPRVAREASAWASALLGSVRFSYAMRCVGVGGSAVTDGGAEVTVLEDGQLIANAPYPIWHRRISANETGSDQGQQYALTIPGESNPLTFRMRPGHEYTFNVGFWAFADKSSGLGAAVVQGLVEGSASELHVGWFK